MSCHLQLKHNRRITVPHHLSVLRMEHSQRWALLFGVEQSCNKDLKKNKDSSKILGEGSVMNLLYRVSQKSVRLQEGRSVHKRTLFLGHQVLYICSSKNCSFVLPVRSLLLSRQTSDWNYKATIFAGTNVKYLYCSMVFK